MLIYKSELSAFHCLLSAKEVLILCRSCLASNIVTFLIQKPCNCARIVLTPLKLKISSNIFLIWLDYFSCVMLLYFGVLTNLFLAGRDEVKPDVV